MIENKIKYSSIYFDLDSTLVSIEGLDELASFHNKKHEVAKLTRKSMSGEVKLEDVFALKMAIIRPTKNDFKRLGKIYINNLVPDSNEVIQCLKYLGKIVVIMTGNFYPAVKYVSRYLKIEDNNVFANQIYFDSKGMYLTFDTDGPLSVAGGKRSLMLILKREKQKVVFVGDGATDMETKPPVDLFIGYGGVIVRKKVKEVADIFVEHRSMSSILPYVLTDAEKKEILNTKFKKLLLKGESLVS